MSTSGSTRGSRQPRQEPPATPVESPYVNQNTGMVVGEQGIKLPAPSRFAGKKGTLMDFINQTDLYMAYYQEQFMKPEARNLFLISYLEGDAAKAMGPQFQEYLRAREPGAMQDDQTPFMNERNYVRGQLIAYFKDTTEERQLERKLMTVVQKGPATEYTAKFRGIAVRLSWSKSAQMAQYRRGLKEEIKDELATQNDPESLGQLISMAHAIDNRLHERRLERKAFGTKGNLGKKENVSAATAKPTRKGRGGGNKKQKDLSKVECYGCHKKGHYKNKCPNLEQVAAVTVPHCDSEFAYECQDDNCTVHWGKKESLIHRQRKFELETQEAYGSWDQVAAVNSEDPGSPDPQWANDSSSSHYGSDGFPKPEELDSLRPRRGEESSSSEEGELLPENDSQSSLVEVLQADREVSNELIANLRERLESADAQVRDLWARVEKAEEYAQLMTTEHPLNALIAVLSPHEVTVLTGSIARLAMVTRFEELFTSVAKEVSKQEMGGLAVIEGLVSRRIRETLQAEPCGDPLDVVHVNVPRGSRFLRDGGVLLPDRRLVPWELRNRARMLANEIRALPEHEAEIPPSKFASPLDFVEPNAPKSGESKN